MPISLMLVLSSLVVGLLAFANGSNDLSRSAATLVGSGISTYDGALRWGLVWTFIGSILSGALAAHVGQRFVKSLPVSPGQEPGIILAVALGAIIFVVLATLRSLPVSTTHAILGSIVAVRYLATGTLQGSYSQMLTGFLVPLVLSPLIAILGVMGIRALMKFFQGDHGWAWLSDLTAGGNRLSLRRLHWLSSALVGLARGVNDSAKIWALMVPLIAFYPERQSLLPVAIVYVALCMALGGWMGGKRVTHLLAHRVGKMDHTEGFIANLCTSGIILSASVLGFPVASSHVIGGAIVGLGLSRQKQAIQWRVVLDMALAWIMTLPGAATMGCLCYLAALDGMPWVTAFLKKEEPVLPGLVTVALAAGVALVMKSVSFRSRAAAAQQPMAASSHMLPRSLVFICKGNKNRSAMAEAICKTEFARRLGIPVDRLEQAGFQIVSAGLAPEVGAPMSAHAQEALRQIGVPARGHLARKLDAQIAGAAEIIYCMTQKERETAVGMFPEYASKIVCLLPEQDIHDPTGKEVQAFLNIGLMLRQAIMARVQV